MISTLILFPICYILWIVYFLIEGYREAYYFNALSLQFVIQDKQKKDLHGIFTYQRLIIFGLINLVCIGLTWKLLLLSAALVLIQPLIHNGMYYKTRNYLNYKLYPKTWLDMSTTSTAKSTKFETPTLRLVYAGISIILIIILFII